jgi:hypothetical protein
VSITGAAPFPPLTIPIDSDDEAGHEWVYKEWDVIEGSIDSGREGEERRMKRTQTVLSEHPTYDLLLQF